MKKLTLTLAAIAIAFCLLAPVALFATNPNQGQPDPWYPPIKDTTGSYELIQIGGVWYNRLVCPAPGEIRCQLLRFETLPIIDMDLLGWFDTDNNYYYFHAKNDAGTIVNDKDGTIIMAVPKEFFNE